MRFYRHSTEWLSRCITLIRHRTDFCFLTLLPGAHRTRDCSHCTRGRNFWAHWPEPWMRCGMERDRGYGAQQFFEARLLWYRHRQLFSDSLENWRRSLGYVTLSTAMDSVKMMDTYVWYEVVIASYRYIRSLKWPRQSGWRPTAFYFVCLVVIFFTGIQARGCLHALGVYIA